MTYHPQKVDTDLMGCGPDDGNLVGSSAPALMVQQQMIIVPPWVLNYPVVQP